MKIETLNTGIELKREISCLEHEVSIMIGICKEEEGKRCQPRWISRDDESLESRRLVVAYEYYETHPNARRPANTSKPYSIFNLGKDDIISMIKTRQDKIAVLKQQLEKL
jgi:hypothetical protein